MDNFFLHYTDFQEFPVMDNYFLEIISKYRTFRSDSNFDDLILT